MLEWDILNYLKKWRTNLRATKMFLAIAASIRVHLCFYIGIVFLMEYFKKCKNYVTE